MTHIGFTGPLAGHSYCGLTPQEIAQRGDKRVHLPYIGKDHLIDFVALHINCPGCKRAFREIHLEE